MNSWNNGGIADRLAWDRQAAMQAALRWRAARVLAFGGAALFAFAAWGPWITGYIVYSFNQQDLGGDINRYPFSFDSSLSVYPAATGTRASVSSPTRWRSRR